MPNTDHQSQNTQDQSFIKDGDQILTADVTLDSYSQFLQNAAFQYDAQSRHDRAAGMREAAAAFDKAYKGSSKR